MITRRTFCQSTFSLAALGLLSPTVLLGKVPQKLTLVNVPAQKSLVVENTPDQATKINAFFPCPVTNRTGTLDPQMVALLFALAAQLKVAQLDIVSAYRDLDLVSPERQAVGDHLVHYQGRALDLRVPAGGMSLWVKAAKAVGFKNTFVMESSHTLHLDMGPKGTS